MNILRQHKQKELADEDKQPYFIYIWTWPFTQKSDQQSGYKR